MGLYGGTVRPEDSSEQRLRSSQVEIRAT